MTNHADTGVTTAVQSLGITYAFDRQRVDEHIGQWRLVQALADWSVTKPGLFLHYSNRRHPSPALKAFIDCMVDRDPTKPQRGSQPASRAKATARTATLE